MKDPQTVSPEANLQLICCPIGSPKTDVGVGRANLNLATLWLSWVRFTSLNSLNSSGSKQTVRTSGINQFTNNEDITVLQVTFSKLKQGAWRDWKENKATTRKWEALESCLEMKYFMFTRWKKLGIQQFLNY